jgi:hypothetical protein
MSYPIKNMYVEVLDPKYLDKPREFERQKQINLNLLTSFIAVGSTGSFKTNSVLQIILAYGDVWDSFTLCARTTDEPLYRWFTDYMQEQLRLGKIQWSLICDDLSELPPLDAPKGAKDAPYSYGSEKSLNHCVIVDDYIMSSPAKLAVLNDMFTRGRKYGITLFVMSQDWRQTPLYFKRNATYFILKAIPPRQIKRIAGDVTSDITPEEFVKRYSAAMKEPHDFFLVDKSQSSMGRPELLYRRNLG